MNTIITQSETYEVFETIGCGSVSTIYDGYDHILKREIAIKELRAEFQGDTDVAEAFWGEATLLAGLNHANILRVHGIDRGRHWIIMEPMPTSVDAELKTTKLSLIRILDILRQTLEGLRYLHSMDRVHGQIRLDSLLADGSGNVKLTNLSESDIDGEFRRPDEKQLHNAPEILNPRHFGQPGLSSDLYCVGIVALQLLTGDKFLKLFKGMDRKRQLDPMAWSAWHASSEPIGSVQALVADIPSDILVLVEGLTQKQVGLRFASAAEAIGAISPQVFQSSMQGSGCLDRNASAESMSKDEATVIYNSPNIYSPKRALTAKKKVMTWQSLLREAIVRFPVLRNRKLMLSGVGMFVGLLFCAVMLNSENKTNAVQAAVAEAVDPQPQTTMRLFEYDFKRPEVAEPPKSEGSIKLVLKADQDGPAVDGVLISIDGLDQVIKPSNKPGIDDGSEAMTSETDGAEGDIPAKEFRITSSGSGSPINIVGPPGCYDLKISAPSFQSQQRIIQLVAEQNSVEIVQMEAKSFSVVLSVKPPTAKVLIDGRPLPGPEIEHRQVRLPWGKHQIVVAANGFVDQMKTITIQSETSATFTLVPIATASAIIDSFPQGATIMIAGKIVGRTPLLWSGRLGKYDLKLSLPGFVEISTSLILDEESQNERLCWYLQRPQDLLAVSPEAIKIGQK
ncbi:MAG: PEGA domain-containing protein [Pirellulaceae bacterium]|nr:PEGA domain-containing protein [Pirellulaceae bacterium]